MATHLAACPHPKGQAVFLLFYTYGMASPYKPLICADCLKKRPLWDYGNGWLCVPCYMKRAHAELQTV